MLLLFDVKEYYFPPKLFTQESSCNYTSDLQELQYAGSEMAGFDEQPVFFSDPFGSSQDQGDDLEINRVQTQKRFRDFIRQFHEGTFVYPYR